MAKRGIVICADDFGLSAGIDAAVIELIGNGRLSATSVMVAGPDAAVSAADLLATTQVAEGRAEVGLHLTFTDLAPLGDVPGLERDGRRLEIGDLIKASVGSLPDYASIRAEVARQIDRFVEIFGRRPAYVDGHQHVHLLPRFRRAVLAAIDDGLLPRGTWIRSCHEPALTILRRGVVPAKAGFISLLSTGLASAARRHGATTNDSFRGVSAFDGSPVRPNFQRFLAGAGRRPLIMCHPSKASGDTPFADPIAAARLAEYAYLAGPDFAADLESAGLEVTAFSRL